MADAPRCPTSCRCGGTGAVIPPKIEGGIHRPGLLTVPCPWAEKRRAEAERDALWERLAEIVRHHDQNPGQQPGMESHIESARAALAPLQEESRDG